MQPVSEGSPAWQRLQNPPPGTPVFEELSGRPQINRHHVLTSAPPDAPCDEAVPTLLTDARKWQAVVEDVPGMQPQMVLIADLLGQTDSTLALQLSRKLEDEGLEGVSHVSMIFSRLRSKFLSRAEAESLLRVGTNFFAQLGTSLAAMAEQWPRVMEWRAKRIMFAHPLTANGLNMTKLQVLEDALDADPVFVPVKEAALVMLKAARAEAPVEAPP